MEKYDALVKRLQNDSVHDTHHALHLVNPFTHEDLREYWTRRFSGRLEALNDRSKLQSKRLLVFFDYWPLGHLRDVIPTARFNEYAKRNSPIAFSSGISPPA
jgi:hypothetical protein